MATTALKPFKKRLDPSVKIKYADFLPGKKEGGISYNDFIPLMKLFVESFARRAATYFYGNARIQVLDRFKYYTGRFYDSFFYDFVVEKRGIRVKLDMDKMQAIAPYWKRVNKGSKPRHVDVDVLKDWIKKKREFYNIGRDSLYRDVKVKAGKTYLSGWKEGSGLIWKRTKMGLRKDMMSFYKLSPTGASIGRMSDREAAEKIQSAILRKGTKSSKFKLMGQRRGEEFEPFYLKYEKYLMTAIHESNKEWLSKEIDKYKKSIAIDIDAYKFSFTDTGIKKAWEEFSYLFDLIFSAWLGNITYELSKKAEKKAKKPRDITVTEYGADKVVKKTIVSKTFAPIYAIAPVDIDNILKKYCSGALKYYSKVYPKEKAIKSIANVMLTDMRKKYTTLFEKAPSQKVIKESEKIVRRLFKRRILNIYKELSGRTEDITIKPEVKEFLAQMRKSGLMKTVKESIAKKEFLEPNLGKELVNSIVNGFLQKTGLDTNEQFLKTYTSFVYRLHKLLLKGK